MDKKKILTAVGIGIAAVALLFTNEKVRKETRELLDKVRKIIK